MVLLKIFVPVGSLDVSDHLSPTSVTHSLPANDWAVILTVHCPLNVLPYGRWIWPTFHLVSLIIVLIIHHAVPVWPTIMCLVGR